MLANSFEADGARTTAATIGEEAGPRDIVSPGHVFPVVAHPLGVLGRPRPLEAVVDLARLAGGPPAAVICAILDDSGAVASERWLRRLQDQHGLAGCAVSDVVDHCRRVAAADAGAPERRRVNALQAGA